MPEPRIMLDERKMKEAKPKETKPKKEFTPKVRNAGHFLFVQDGEDRFERVFRYPDLKSFQEGVKEKAKAISDGEEIPNWVHFRGTFKKVEIERIRDVKVKL